MPSGYTLPDGTDLDDVFMPRGSTTPAADTGFDVLGVDLADRYMASTGPGDRIASPTGWTFGSSSTDLQEVFRDISYVAPSAPTITSNPSGATITEGGSLTLSVTATGPGTLTYQWKKNGSNISGATSSSLTFSSINRTDDASYTCAVTNAYGTTTSSAAVVDVQFGPSITSNPSSFAGMEGDTCTFTVGVSAGDPSTTTYQWQRDTGSGYANITGGKFSGYNSSSLSFTTDLSDDAVPFRCIVSNSVGSATSADAACAVDQIFDPAINGNPSNINQPAGSGPHALQCSIIPGSGVNYFTWKKDGITVVGPRVGNISSTQDQHVFNPLTSGDAGTWQCFITTSYGRSTHSNTATVTVTIANPTITGQPSAITATDGDGPLALQCHASGGYGGLSFAWYKDGSLIEGPRAGNIDSGTGDQHVWNPIHSGDSGNYKCRVTTPYGGQTDSSTVAVTVS